MSWTYGVGMDCCSMATRPAKSGRVSLANQAKLPKRPLNWVISFGVEKLYLSRFLPFSIGMGSIFWENKGWWTRKLPSILHLISFPTNRPSPEVNFPNL